jgi:hypothetical protein
MPEEAFVAIETLLPTGKGRFLELWAPNNARRAGWTQVAAGQEQLGLHEHLVASRRVST